MQHIADVFQSIARQRGRGDAGPLVMLRQLDPSAGDRISHLPIEPDLAQAWVRITGEPFRPHQAQVLAGLRRGDPVALRTLSPNAAVSAQLLVCAQVLSEANATALLIAPDEQTAHMVAGQLSRIAEHLPARLHLAITLVQSGTRPDPSARVVITTAEVLHRRLLRHHERAWQRFWAGLRLITIHDLHRTTGVAAAHLADLLLRSQRVAALHAGGRLPATLATVADVAELEPMLQGLLGQPWRVIAADDLAWPSTCFAVWQAGGQRLREASDLATILLRQGFQVHLGCHAFDAILLHLTLGDAEGLTIGGDPGTAQVLILVGFPGSLAALRRTLHAGYQGVLLVLGEVPLEQALARRVSALLNDPLPALLPPPPNAYVTAQHVLCAASELPLAAAEVDAWGAQSVVDRLVAAGQLVDLPDPEIAWKPVGADDPYAEFSLLSSSGAAIAAQTEQGLQIAQLDPTGFERWCFSGAALPPTAGGMRVAVRDDASGSIVLRPETTIRRTFPLRRCDVQVREEREARLLPGQYPIAWGRVLINEETFGYRELTAGATPGQQHLPQPLSVRWVAPACWITLPQALNQQTGQLAGWSIVTALTLRNLAAFTDLVPCYDPISHRLYLVDAQPGGNGLAQRVYQTAEELLPLAYDVALACRSDPFLEPLCRVDMDWLLTLLGRSAEPPPDQALVLALPPRPRTPEPPPPQRPADPAPRPARPPAPAEPRDLLDDLFRTAPSRPPAGAGPSSGSSGRVESRSVPGSGQPSANMERPAQPIAPEPAEHRDPPTESRPAQPPLALPDDDLLPPIPEPPPARSKPAPQSPARQERTPPAERSNRPRPPSAPRDVRRETPRTAHSASDTPQHAPGNGSAPPQRTPGNAPPARPPAQPPEQAAPPEDPVPDAAALIERLRRQRQEREQPRQQRAPVARVAATAADPATMRFAVGDHVFCLPYGDGIVRAGMIEDGREVLIVAFKDHGELTIDPAVSLVRKLEQTPDPPDDDLL